MKKLLLLLTLFITLTVLFSTFVKASEYFTVGNDVQERSVRYPDDWEGMFIIDKGRPSANNGYLATFGYYALDTVNPLQFVVLDPSNTVTWVSEVVYPPFVGANFYNAPAPVAVENGYMIGIYFPQYLNVGSVSDGSGYSMTEASQPAPYPGFDIGNYTWGGLFNLTRYYSFIAFSKTLPFGVVNSPAEDAVYTFYPENEGSSLGFSATYWDSDPEVNELSWGIHRSGCGTEYFFEDVIAGNLLGKDLQLERVWDGRNFNVEVPWTLLTEGNYCFIFDPFEPEGTGQYEAQVDFSVVLFQTPPPESPPPSESPLPSEPPVSGDPDPTVTAEPTPTPFYPDFNFTVGLDDQQRDEMYPDNWEGVIIADTARVSLHWGYLTTFYYYAINQNPLHFVVFDPDNKVTWVSELITPDNVGVNQYKPDLPVHIMPGSVLGVYFPGLLSIGSMGEGGGYSITLADQVLPVVDDISSLYGWWHNDSLSRHYSFYALSEPLATPEPSPTETSIPTPTPYEELDDDEDGILNKDDFCKTIPPTDDFPVLGVQRWKYDGDQWYQQPNPRGFITNKIFDLVQTKGCGCMQMIEMLQQVTGEDFAGQIKYGCSATFMEAFISDAKDGLVDGNGVVETLEVPTSSWSGVSSTNVLSADKYYVIEASGVWSNNLTNTLDAEYASSDNFVFDITDGLLSPFADVNQFDLQIDNNFVNWGLFNPIHIYTTNYLGRGEPVNFRVFEGDSSTNNVSALDYFDNYGKFQITIYEKLH